MESSFTVDFPNGVVAQALKVNAEAELTMGLTAMGLGKNRPVLVVVGGASLIAPADLIKLQTLFTEILAPLAQDLGCYVVDGGTDAGVMKLIGNARSEIRSGGTIFPLIGVAPIGLVKLPQRNTADDVGRNLADNINEDPTELEPHHSHFVLVPGNQWGNESGWLARIASLLAGDYPSVTVLINGGAIALVDAQSSIREQRPIVTIAGSGRLADEIAMAILHPDQPRRPAIESLLAEGQIDLVDLTAALLDLSGILRQKLSGAKM